VLSQKLLNKAWRVLALAVVAILTTLSLGWPVPAVPALNMDVRGSRNLKVDEACSNHLISQGQLIHIPGPDPAIVTGGPGAWDESVIESCDVVKDGGKYYWYYHGVPKDQKPWPHLGYRIGVATSDAPLGPFVKYKGNPILNLGPEGSWDDRDVACAVVLKTGVHKYYMWYCGKGSSEEYKRWSIGLATAPSPLGPWKKFAGNPILKGFGYSGGVVYHNGTYFLYAEDPIGSTAPDYGPISLATASRPEGPWTAYKGNPVLKAGDWGAWDDAGFSEANVLYWGGLFHIFYGGAKRYIPRMLTRESIGYAYSFDGYHFIKYAENPVARREDVPNAAAFAEVHALVEPPYIYLYHTLRYVSYPSPDFPRIENLGIEVLSVRKDFRLAMPVLQLASLQPGATTSLDACPAINVENASSLAVTIECRYEPQAKAGLTIHVRSSDDGVHYDTSDLATVGTGFRPDETSRTTRVIPTKTRFIKLLIENQDSQHGVGQIEIAATLSGR
jgi:hypothetical protein